MPLLIIYKKYGKSIIIMDIKVINMEDEKKNATKRLQDLAIKRGLSNIVYEQFSNKHIVRKSTSSFSDGYSFSDDD